MKTNYLTQKKEQEIHWDQRDQRDPKVQTDSNQLLEDDERILHSETLESSGCTIFELASPIFLIFGFPFYAVGGFIAVTAYLSDKNLEEIVQAILWPAGLLAVVAVFSLLMAVVMQKAYRLARARL